MHMSNALFYKQCFFSPQAQMLISKIQIYQKLALPYLKKSIRNAI